MSLRRSIFRFDCRRTGSVPSHGAEAAKHSGNISDGVEMHDLLDAALGGFRLEDTLGIQQELADQIVVARADDVVRVRALRVTELGSESLAPRVNFNPRWPRSGVTHHRLDPFGMPGVGHLAHQVVDLFV